MSSYKYNFQNATYSNTNQTHPLQQSSQEYYEYKKYVSIHSEDRDVLSYPNSSQFEIEMPEDITNISTVKMINWAFPSNYNVFSESNGNITLMFSINTAYNPGEHGYNNNLQNTIFAALFYNQSNKYVITIEEGFYNPTQMVTELQNKMNEAVTQYIISYMNTRAYTDLLEEFITNGGYNRFVVVYNSVSLKIWFGNKSDIFTIFNSDVSALSNLNTMQSCVRNRLPDYSDWGLSSNLGLPRYNTTSLQATLDSTPRFYYGDVNSYNDKGYWLLPDASCPGALVTYVECSYKINLFGPSYIYISIDGLNNIDVTSPFNTSDFTLKTNGTNGIVNSAFAKLPISSTPISQYYDRDAPYYKFFEPAKDRIRRLKIKITYHNDELVDFGIFNYTFTLEFTQLLPIVGRKLIKYGN